MCASSAVPPARPGSRGSSVLGPRVVRLSGSINDPRPSSPRPLPSPGWAAIGLEPLPWGAEKRARGLGHESSITDNPTTRGPLLPKSPIPLVRFPPRSPLGGGWGSVASAVFKTVVSARKRRRVGPIPQMPPSRYRAHLTSEYWPSRT